LLEADKTYLATVHLGVRTDTGDTEGQVLETRDVRATQEEIDAVLARFRGPIKQVPPMYSALKRDGKPLYEYAREGITLEREARDVVIHKLELVGYAAPFLKIEVTCSKGTYIRVLGEDIGAALGCGAHLNALRRTQVGALTTDKMVTLEELAAHAAPRELLAPVDALLSSFPRIVLSDELAKRFLHGQRLPLGKEPSIAVPAPYEGRVRVYAADGRLLGTGVLGEYAILAPERLIASAA
jgi:tRNA pseudouridine55 synthase